MVIPAMDHINMYFTNVIKQTSGNNPAIQAAMRITKKTLNHYYLLTDASETYRIAMGESSLFYDRSIAEHCLISVLHPRHKLAYFKSAGWRDS